MLLSCPLRSLSAEGLVAECPALLTMSGEIPKSSFTFNLNNSPTTSTFTFGGAAPAPATPR